MQPIANPRSWRSTTIVLAAVCLLTISGCNDNDNSGGAPTPTAMVKPSATMSILPPATATAASSPTPTVTSTAADTPTPTATPSITPTPTATFVPFADPGSAPWVPVPEDEVAARCGLDPELLKAADPMIGRPYAVIRYGQLCHEYYPDGDASTDPSQEVFSTTKTLGSVVTGIVAYQTKGLVDNGRKTGPLSDADRVDHWLDSFTFNPDALVAHVLAMLAQNSDLSLGHKTFQYDIVGTVQINRMSDIINTVVQQDPDRLGANLEEVTQRFLFQPLGMHDSVWNGGAPNKVFAFSWHSTVRDMARLGLLMLHEGMWSGERILDASWVYKMTHPSFEDANTGYGYLTWMNAANNWTLGLGDGLHDAPLDPCAPLSLNTMYPHGLSDSPDCHYNPPYTCEQTFDVGMWYAAGAQGQYIVGHRGLDLLLVVKNYAGGPNILWQNVRPALVALDPTFTGDEVAFCAQYSRNAYAPNRH